MARLLHTSDWHLGRQINRKSRDDEFDKVIAEIDQIARQAEPDLIIHSGDLFDTVVPGVETLIRGLYALRLLQETAPVLVVAGNHDGRRVLAFLDKIENGYGTDPRDGRIRFVTEAAAHAGAICEYPAAGADHTLRVGALPFLHKNRFRYEFDDPATAPTDYAARLRQVQQDLYAGLRAGSRPDHDVLVFAAHLFVEGAQPSYSERRVDTTDDYATAADALPPVAYGALGHIHKPQSVGRSGFPARYAGSPMQLDFGESGEAKSLVVVESSPGRRTGIETVELTAGRRLVRVEGTLEQIAARYGGVGDAYVKALVHTDRPTPDLADALARILPRADLVAVEEYCPATAAHVLTRANTEDELPGTEDLFREYLAAAGTSGVAVDDVMSSLADLVGMAQSDDAGRCCEEELLQAALAGGDIEAVDTGGLLIGAEAVRTAARAGIGGGER